MVVSILTGLIEGIIVKFQRTTDKYRLVDGVDRSIYCDEVLCITGRYPPTKPHTVRYVYEGFPLSEYTLVCPD